MRAGRRRVRCAELACACGGRRGWGVAAQHGERASSGGVMLVVALSAWGTSVACQRDRKVILAVRSADGMSLPRGAPTGRIATPQTRRACVVLGLTAGVAGSWYAFTGLLGAGSVRNYGSGRSRMSFRPAFWRGGIQPTLCEGLYAQAEDHTHTHITHRHSPRQSLACAHASVPRARTASRRPSPSLCVWGAPVLPSPQSRRRGRSTVRATHPAPRAKPSRSSRRGTAPWGPLWVRGERC